MKQLTGFKEVNCTYPYIIANDPRFDSAQCSPRFAPRVRAIPGLGSAITHVERWPLGLKRPGDGVVLAILNLGSNTELQLHKARYFRVGVRVPDTIVYRNAVYSMEGVLNFL